jgi:hypothetical protein
MTKLYLAGPMRGYRDQNYPAFEVAAKRLREAGHNVYSPVEDNLRQGITPEVAKDETFLKVRFLQDLKFICEEAEGIAVMEGWQQSKGAKAEAAVGVAIGVPWLEVETWVRRKP